MIGGSNTIECCFNVLEKLTEYSGPFYLILLETSIILISWGDLIKIDFLKTYQFINSSIEESYLGNFDCDLDPSYETFQ